MNGTEFTRQRQTANKNNKLTKNFILSMSVDYKKYCLISLSIR